MSLIKIHDGISPDLRKRAAAVADKRPLLAIMGQSIKALGIQAFTDPAKRPTYWAPRKDSKPHALLQLSTMLRKSIRVTSITGDTVTVGSDRNYASTQQMGRGSIPARPYLPFYKSGQMTPLGRQQTDRGLRAGLRVRGL